MAQGLLLREHGYRCDHGILYFAASRTRVPVPFTPALEERTLSLLDEAREAERGPVPPPLDDSPKCNGCSLSGICLPDETNALAALTSGGKPQDVRRLYPARDHALPFYVQSQGAAVGKTRASVVVREGGVKVATVRFKDMSQLVLCGNVSVSAQALHVLCEAGIPIVHYSTGFWFYGITTGWGLKNGYARAAQYRCGEDEGRRLAAAKAFVRAKGQNQRTLLRRNAIPRPDAELNAMRTQLEHLDRATGREELLGLEGGLAAAYFRRFSAMFKQTLFGPDWDFDGRNRRPPRDPVNAMLSFCYALLVKDCTVALLAEGLDPYWGLFHQPRHGRPALALDLMEEFRPLIADSAVLSAINTMMVKPEGFRTGASGCVMDDKARKSVIRAYEARMDQMVTHPVFDYRCSWRSVIRVQARLLARWMRGETDGYVGFTTR
jgi:CRISPR-associated protein Cas1